MTTLFVSSTGGHLSELLAVADCIPDDGPRVWVTHDSAQSRSALRGRDVEFVPYVRARHLGDVARCLPTAHRLWRGRAVRRAVSTGSGIALGFLPYLARRGVECHFVESATRVAGPSLTGRLLAGTPGVHAHARYRGWAAARWRYAGNELDGFAPVAAAREPDGLLRVVVLVGTCGEFGFERMLRPLARLLAPGGPVEAAVGMPVRVLWQTAGLPVAHLGIRPTPFLPAAALADEVAAADVVVCHAGVGCATEALRAGRPPVVVARRHRYGEAPDDHQVEYARELVRRGLAVDADPGALTADALLATLARSVTRTRTVHLEIACA